MNHLTMRCVLATCIILAASSVAVAQQSAKVPRIGFVAGGASATFGGVPVYRAFLDGMRDLGYVEGRDFTMEVRAAQGRPERFAELTAEVVQSRVDLMLVGVCGAPLDAASRATQTIPIVVATCNDDMVETGVVASMRRPGGNITGLSKLTPELAAKRLDLLKQLVPAASRVAVLWNPGYSEFKADWREIRAAARTLGVTLHPVEFRRADEFEAAFAAIGRERVDAMIMFSDQQGYIHAKRVADLAAAARLPAMYAFREAPDAGGLMSYGPSLNQMWYRAADYVVKILKGAKPADMPVEQPTRFEMVINRQAAKALGLTIPRAILVQADQVIE